MPSIQNRLPVLCLATLVACSATDEAASEPGGIAGTYSVSLTNQQNDCQFADWVVGDQATNIELIVRQDGKDVSCEVMSLAALALWSQTGGTTFRGTLEGKTLRAEIQGTTLHTEAKCEYWVDAALQSSVADDTMTGSIRYEKRAKPGSSCSVPDGCSSVQEFAAARPPT
jgi:hypothetical protein